MAAECPDDMLLTKPPLAASPKRDRNSWWMRLVLGVISVLMVTSIVFQALQWKQNSLLWEENRLLWRENSAILARLEVLESKAMAPQKQSMVSEARGASRQDQSSLDEDHYLNPLHHIPQSRSNRNAEATGAAEESREDQNGQGEERSSNRRRDRERRCRENCKGDAGPKGDKGERGERGEPGPPGNCSTRQGLSSIHMVADVNAIIDNTTEAEYNDGQNVDTIDGGKAQKSYGYRTKDMNGTDEVYRCWRSTYDVPSEFRVTNDNLLQVTHAGVYFVYAQIVFVVYEHSTPVFTLRTNSSAPDYLLMTCPIGNRRVIVDESLGNNLNKTALEQTVTRRSAHMFLQPCHTSGLVYLEARSLLWIKTNNFLNRISLSKGASFFGVIKVS